MPLSPLQVPQNSVVEYGERVPGRPELPPRRSLSAARAGRWRQIRDIPGIKTDPAGLQGSS